MSFEIRGKKLFLILIFLGSNINSGVYNSHGVVGYINTPSAFINSEGHFAFGYRRTYPDTKGFITASPFNWLEASIFYVDIAGKEYGGNYKQSYKDKGANFKLNLFDSRIGTASIGIQDLGGTGLFSSEYIVFSREEYNFDYSIGIGWGTFNSGIQINNPLIHIRNGFANRPTFKESRNSGRFNPETFFSGKKASIFFGSKLQIGDKLDLLVEYDPTDTSGGSNKVEGGILYSPKKTSLNIGLSKNSGSWNFSSGVLRGSEIYFSFAFSKDYSKYQTHSFKPKAKIMNYSDFQETMERNNIGLVTISESESENEITIKQNVFNNQYEVNQFVIEESRKLQMNEKPLLITHKHLDMEVLKVFYPHDNANSKNEIYVQKKGEKSNIKYLVKEKYPIIFSNLSPNLRTQIATREGFIFNGLLLEHDMEVIFFENFYIKSNLKYSLYDNFDQLSIGPVDTYPNQVRSDVKEYLKGLSDGISIGRLEFNYLKEFGRKHFFRVSGGIFEEMFSGAGIEYVYYPEGSFISTGLEHFYVKKRDYDMRTTHLDYDNSMTRVFMNIFEPMSKINLKLSYGEYLAGDVGTTFEINKRFDSGVSYGIFFSLTDVTYEQYGEGSFDKGVTFKIPFDIFSKNNALGKYVWRPLTKDPASLLVKSYNLIENLQRYRVY